MRRGLCRDDGAELVAMEPNEYNELDPLVWDDDIDFGALDCVELEAEEIELSDEEWEEIKGEW